MTRLGRWEAVLVASLVLVGAALRCWHLELGWFGVDQARDVQTALDIAAGHDLPTVGPTMRRVTSLGALYHYVWALPHLVSDDPIAAYRFAAGLGVATLGGTWLFARHAWGSLPALVALAALATSRVAVIDGRVAWAPAALPPVAIACVWLLAGPMTAARLGVLGALLGVAVQLHLSMAAWVIAAVPLVLSRRPSVYVLASGVVGAILTGFPAVYAMLANAGGDAGIGTLPSRGPVPSVLRRLAAAWSLEWRVPDAFWQWPDVSPPWPDVTRACAVVLATAVVLGIGRSALAARYDRAARVLVVVLACQLGMVALLPGDAWYYYLDALLPIAALASAQVVVACGSRPGLSRGLAAVLVGAALVPAGWTARWLAELDTHGFVVLAPAALALDGAGGRDAAVTGRLPTLATKRALAALLGAESATFAERWERLHGPAFDDVTGDNGFWLGRVSLREPAGSAAEDGLQAEQHRGDPRQSGDPAGVGRHAAVWYRDDPTAPVAATSRFTLDDVGPLRVARYRPALAYATCRDAGGRVAVPIRVLPAPRRYGDGTVARPRELPPRLACEVEAGEGGTRVVAAVTHGTVALTDEAGRRSTPAGTSELCVLRGPMPLRLTLDVVVGPGEASDLDLYERPDPACDAGKIAP